MKVLKKLKNRLLILSVLLGLSIATNAQSKIGVPAPSFQTNHSILLKTYSFNFDKNPFELDHFFYLLGTNSAPLNSLADDDIPASFSTINNFNHNTMPFFCKIEFKMEKASGFPVKFRLGDVQYVDQLEGKTDYIAPAW